ncbi:hypothetical protein [Pseudothauera rhizosphaerae]|nr:hypothetical protein [Pseudothauera rhizosphaerae]
MRNLNNGIALLAAMLFGAAGPVRAERPMNVDDAGTLDKGGAKLEFGWAKDDETRGIEGAAGYAPIDNLELEIGLGRARDHSASPTETIHGHGLAVKWVPLQAETGLSAGLKYEYGRDRVEGVSTRVHALSGLLTWAFGGGQLLHVNLGREIERERGDSEEANTWGAGLDLPLTEQFHVVAETFGAEGSGPDRAAGLRYEIAEGLKISGAVGRGNHRNFANAGIAWEF